MSANERSKRVTINVPRRSEAMKILLAVDGSENALRAAQRLTEVLGLYREPPSIEVLTVHLPIPHVPRMSAIVAPEAVEKYYAEESGEMLKPVCAVLDAAGVTYQTKTRVGQVAETIVAESKEHGFDVIWLGNRGRTAIANMVVGSVATRVLHLTDVPVVLVP
jgi:nucleotide-binding universal stress UspA family protein